MFLRRYRPERNEPPRPAARDDSASPWVDLHRVAQCADAKLDDLPPFAWVDGDLRTWLRDGGGIEPLEIALTHGAEHGCAFLGDRDPEAEPHLPLFADPGKLLGVGINFLSHLEEGNRAGMVMQAPDAPILFSKIDSTLAGNGDSIVKPPDGNLLDYEVELAVVINRACRNLETKDGLDYIAGYVVVNDLSIRDLLFTREGMFLGKNFDNFLPMSETLVTKPSIPSVDELVLESFVDGEARQHERMGNAMFRVEEIVAYASQKITLSAGDVIFCGTPEGVGVFADPPEQGVLRPGQTVEVRVEGVGSVINSIA